MFTLKEIEDIRDRAYTEAEAVKDPVMDWTLPISLRRLGDACSDLIYDMKRKKR